MNVSISVARIPVLACLPALLALLLPTQSAAASALPLAECLRADRIDRWHVDGERALLVRSGARHYRVTLRSVCPDLGRGGFLSLSGAQGARDFVCGNVGENVKARYGDCAIGVVSPLSRKEFLRQVRLLR